MADENQNEIVEENQTEGLMGGVPTEEPKTPDPSDTEYLIRKRKSLKNKLRLKKIKRF